VYQFRAWSATSLHLLLLLLSDIDPLAALDILHGHLAVAPHAEHLCAGRTRPTVAGVGAGVGAALGSLKLAT